MAAPLVSWRDDSNSVITSWDSGVVNAGEASAVQKIRVWNNYGNADDVSAMQECKLSVVNGMVDAAPSPTDLLYQKWVTVTTVKEAGSSVSPLVDQPLGIDTGEVVLTVNLTAYDAATSEGLIYGWGTDSGLQGTANYAEFDATVTPEAIGDGGQPTPAGVRNFKLRVSYYYV